MSDTSITIYDVSVGIYISGITSLLNILKKATLHPGASTFPSATLIDDMKPLAFHIQSASNSVTRSLARLLSPSPASLSIPVFPDTETTLPELISRAEQTLSFLISIEKKELEGMEGKGVSIKGEMVSGKKFILGYGMPSLFFHLQTAYAILRMRGVEVGKADFMDPFAELG